MFHHAHMIIGDMALLQTHQDFQFESNNPDVHIATYARLSIDEVRALKNSTTTRPLVSPYKTFVLEIHTATVEAQNALLKVLEEPVSTTRFYLVVPREDVLIPTVRSRLMTLELLSTSVDPDTNTLAADFLKQSHGERLALIAEKAKEKDVLWMQKLLNALEVWARSEGKYAAISEILFVRSYIDSPGASKKNALGTCGDYTSVGLGFKIVYMLLDCFACARKDGDFVAVRSKTFGF